MIKTVTMPIKRLDEAAILPTYAHADDAGMDLYACEDVLLHPGDRAAVSTGIAIAVPEGYVGLVHPRSGLALNKGITVLNAPGTIDSGYRGEVKVILHNASRWTITINIGDRIAQLVLQEYRRAALVEVSEPPAAERGSNGFGSSGA